MSGYKIIFMPKKVKTNDDYYREIQTRERLVQVFLIIGGFLVANSKENFREFMILTFMMYIIFVIIYYIFLTRSRNDSSINLFGIISSYMFSLFLTIFIYSHLTGLQDINFISLFFLFFLLFSFAFLSPNTSDKIVNRVIKLEGKFENRHPKLIKMIIIILLIVCVIYFSIIMFSIYLK